MNQFALVLVAATSLAAFLNWRVGMLLIMMMGLLQDPLRKVATGQPLYFVLFAGVVFIATYLGAFISKVALAPSLIPGWRQGVGRPFGLFIVLVALQAIHSFSIFWDPMITGIGLMVWLAPIPALMLAFQNAGYSGLRGVRQWLLIYVLCVTAYAATVYLQFSGIESAFIGEVGSGLIIYDVGSILIANSGLFRSSELAAWHISAAAMFVFLLLLGPKLTAPRLLLAACLISYLLGMAVLTGRRKGAVEVVFFVLIYFLLFAWYQKRGLRQLIVLGALALATFFGLALEAGDDLDARSKEAAWRTDSTGIGAYEGYALRGGSAFAEVPARIANLGVTPVVWAVESLGWFGSGLGTGSQSTGGASDTRRNLGAAEGGLGKITVELGVPGLILIAWLLTALVRYINSLLAETSQTSVEHARVAYGIAAFLLAKASSFTVATQAFSDPFVLLILGSLAGYLFAIPFLAKKYCNDRIASGVAHPSAPPAHTSGHTWA